MYSYRPEPLGIARPACPVLEEVSCLRVRALSSGRSGLRLCMLAQKIIGIGRRSDNSWVRNAYTSVTALDKVGISSAVFPFPPFPTQLFHERLHRSHRRIYPFMGQRRVSLPRCL